MRDDLVEKLRLAIYRKYRCRAVHFRTVPVKLEFKGKAIWNGQVEEFHLSACPLAKKCFAWVNGGNQKNNLVIILARPPVDSPRKAVQTHIAENALGS